MTSPWDRILALTRGAREAVIAAPYIKEPSLRRLLEHLPQLERLICVTRWQAGDIAAGVSDTAVRSLVRVVWRCLPVTSQSSRQVLPL